MSGKKKSVRKLMKGFRYNFLHTLIVRPTEPENPRYVASLLGRRDHSVIINNHWVPTDLSSKKKVWGGAVAEFSCTTFARVTAEEIRNECQTLKIIFFKDVMELLIMAERLYPKKDGETTKIVIRGARSFNDGDFLYVKEMFKEFGRPKSVLLRRGVTHGIIGSVAYPTQFQAYAARIATHGMLYDCVGYLNVEIEVTESGQQYDDFVKQRFREMLDGART